MLDGKEKMRWLEIRRFVLLAPLVMLFQMLANLLLLMVRVIGVEKIPTPCAKLPKTTETFSNKSAKKFRVW
jgi:hypothetical protein